MAERIVSKAAETTTAATTATTTETEESKEAVVALCQRLLELHQRSLQLAEHNRAALAALGGKGRANDRDEE